MRRYLFLAIVLFALVGTADAYYTNFTPLMSNDMTPAPNIANASQFQAAGDRAAYKAFDGKILGDDRWQTSAVINNGSSYAWIQMKTGTTPHAINRYNLSAYTAEDNAPFTWCLTGSNDGTTWTTLDIRNGIFGGWTNTNAEGKMKHFNVTSSAPYTYYRLNITAVVTTANVIILNELILYADEHPYPSSYANFSMNGNGITTNKSGLNPLAIQFNDTSYYTNGTSKPTKGIWVINGSVEYEESATSGLFSPAFNISKTFNVVGVHNVSMIAVNETNPVYNFTKYKYVTVNETLVPNFNRTPSWANVYHGNADELINFVDMSTGGMTAWKWDFGDKNTSTARNPWYGYNQTGNFNVNLTIFSVDGQASKNWTSCVRINANNTFTLQIRDSDTFNLITNQVTVQLSQLGVDYTSGTTSTGIIEFELPDGTYDVLVPAIAGIYSGNIASATIAGTDAEGTIYLDPVAGGSKTTWYSPHQVKFDVVDTNGLDTTGFIVNASYTDMSLPLASTVSWLKNLYGISSEVAGDMVNSSLVMNATVGNDGSVVMTMHESIQYRIQVFDPSTGTSSSITLYPKDSEYKLFITTTATTASTLSEINGTRLTFYEPNMSYVTPGLEYQDTSGKTQYFNFSVRCMNNGTYVYWQNVSAPGTARRLVNTTFQNVRGEMYIWAYTATRT